MTVHYIALDVHCGFSEMAVVSGSGKFVRRDRCDTRIPALREAIAQVRRPRRLTFEEGPLADWLSRELRGSVSELQRRIYAGGKGRRRLRFEVHVHCNSNLAPAH